MSSHRPIIPIANAGPISDVASQKLSKGSEVKSIAANVTIETPRIIATPPRYGTGLECDLCVDVGRSMISFETAILPISGVNAPTRKKVEKNKRKFCH